MTEPIINKVNDEQVEITQEVRQVFNKDVLLNQKKTLEEQIKKIDELLAVFN